MRLVLWRLYDEKRGKYIHGPRCTGGVYFDKDIAMRDFHQYVAEGNPFLVLEKGYFVPCNRYYDPQEVE